MLFLLMLILAYVFIVMASGAPPSNPPPEEKRPECIGGAVRQCSAGGCNGTSACSGGAWGDCRWGVVCSPGSRATCLRNGCGYAYKVCNDCGSGYGDCIPFSTPECCG